MSAGMRPQDEAVFAEAAKKFQVWLVVRQTNPASWKYIGLSRYFPKPITCKAKTADIDALPYTGMKLSEAMEKALQGARPRSRYDTAGLVVDADLHPNVFSGSKAADAFDLWSTFKSAYLDAKAPGMGYSVDRDPKSRHFGCVQMKGQYLYGDYDLYDVIVVGHENANLTPIGTRDGVPDYRAVHQQKLESFINGRIGAEMVHHGGQFQYSEHTNHTVEIFGPQGESFVEPAACWYAKHFPNRRPPGPAGGFAAM